MITESKPKARLLMIEDNPGDVGLLRWGMERAGVDYDLSVIGDGGAALELVRHESSVAEPAVPDLIILDLNLPKASGKEILIAMRATTAFATVPVVILTSSNAASDRLQLSALHVNRYLVKPAELGGFQEVGAAIREVLESISKPGPSSAE